MKIFKNLKKKRLESLLQTPNVGSRDYHLGTTALKQALISIRDGPVICACVSSDVVGESL